MNPQTMTCDECRDELARRAGWTFQSAFGNHWWRRVADGGDHEDSDAHPYPPTLDGAAGALPEGYSFDMDVRPGEVRVAAWPAGCLVIDGLVASDAPDELTARYRLALACVLAMEKTT